MHFICCMFVCLLGLFAFRAQFVKMLLLLEMMMLMIFLSVITMKNSSAPSSSSCLSFALFILVLGAIEASLGLSMAVMMTRNSKVDSMSFKSMSMF
uniref:NADH dehydrogenase subunit 4L n=1 Tax=Membranipora villosa TaxID=2857147 RepID=UPI002E7997AD|nr:NADH dehydrogenase subunit 4L [Membranipora villosa]WQB41559.1 NADH dehydrogenase subunit 4L [Membranipora villosa]